MKITSDTKTRMLDTATHLFAERGFYGVSLANIADELGLTKQALIHHFATKEKLYGQVLERISDDIISGSSATDDLETFFETFCGHAIAHPQDSRLLMRELLDNRRRAEEATRWYLEPFLRNLIDRVKATPRWRHAPDPQALSIAYQLLGAVSYFVISEPTLTRILGSAQFSEMQDIYPGEIRRTVRLLLSG